MKNGIIVVSPPAMIEFIPEAIPFLFFHCGEWRFKLYCS